MSVLKKFEDALSGAYQKVSSKLKPVGDVLFHGSGIQPVKQALQPVANKLAPIPGQLADSGFNKEFFNPQLAKGTLKTVFSQEGLGSVQGAGAAARGVYQGGVAPVLNLGVRILPGLSQDRKNLVLNAINAPINWGAANATPVQQNIQKGFAFAGATAPYTALEGLTAKAAAKVAPRLLESKAGQVAFRTGNNVLGGQLLADPSTSGKDRLKQLGSDLLLSGLTEGAGVVAKPTVKGAKQVAQEVSFTPNYMEAARLLDAPLPEKMVSTINGAKVTRPADFPVLSLPEAQAHTFIKTGEWPEGAIVHQYGETGKGVHFTYDPETKKILSISSDDPKFAQKVMERGSGNWVGATTRPIKQSELPPEARGQGRNTRKYQALEYDPKERTYKFFDRSGSEHMIGGEKFFLGKNLAEGWTVTDPVSGTKVSAGKTRQAAIAEAERKLQEAKDKGYDFNNARKLVAEMYGTPKNNLSSDTPLAINSDRADQNATAANIERAIKNGAEVQPPLPIPKDDPVQKLVDTATSKTPQQPFTEPSFTNPVQPSKEVQSYIREQAAAQEKARIAGNPTGVKAKLVELQKALKSGFVDSQAAIEDALTQNEKQYGYRVRPTSDIRLQQASVRRADLLAAQFVEDSGLTKVIQDAPDIDALNQYLIARHAKDVEAAGFTTGRNAEKDARLLQELGPTYEPLARRVTEYSNKALDYAVESGLVSQETAAMLKEKYPNYVPIDRIFSEGEEAIMKPPTGTGRGAMASQGSQSAVRKLKGSEREISNPLETLLPRTRELFVQGERNKSAQMLASYKDLPGNPFDITLLKSTDSTVGKSTISVMENGSKKVYQVAPEIANAAKNLNRQELGLLGRIIGGSTRVFKLGTTGLRPAFVVSNLAKDQVTAIINSNHALKTSVANPEVFLKGFAEAINHGELYKEMQRYAAGGTSLDLYRNSAKQTIKKIRSEKNRASNIVYKATNPAELFRAAEDAINVTEQATRIQQYVGTKEALLKAGRTEKDASLLAAKAARENTIDFYRSGSYGQVLNSTIPYLNAGIQGSRTFINTLRTNPKGAAVKLATTVFMPVTALTLWNMSDPKRKEAYDDIADYEKEGNMILVPPNPTKDEKTGKWNVIKIPLSQEVANLASIVRRGIEGAHGSDPLTLYEVADNLFQSGTSLSLDPRKTISSVTPPWPKAMIEDLTNTNLFTGSKIIPDSLKDLPPEMQVKDSTSSLSKSIGNTLGVSPLRVENAVGDIFGGLGKDIIQQKPVAESIAARFNQATGGKIADKEFKAIEDASRTQAGIKATNKKLLENGVAEYLQASPQDRPRIAQKLVAQKVLTKDTKSDFKKMVLEKANGGALTPTPVEKYLKSQSVDVRATYLRDAIKKIPPGPERTAYVRQLIAKKIITSEVLGKIRSSTQLPPQKQQSTRSFESVPLSSAESPRSLSEDEFKRVISQYFYDDLKRRPTPAELNLMLSDYQSGKSLLDIQIERIASSDEAVNFRQTPQQKAQTMQFLLESKARALAETRRKYGKSASLANFHEVGQLIEHSYK